MRLIFVEMVRRFDGVLRFVRCVGSFDEFCKEFFRVVGHSILLILSRTAKSFSIPL